MEPFSPSPRHKMLRRRRARAQYGNVALEYVKAIHVLALIHNQTNSHILKKKHIHQTWYQGTAHKGHLMTHPLLNLGKGQGQKSETWRCLRSLNVSFYSLFIFSYFRFFFTVNKTFPLHASLCAPPHHLFLSDLWSGAQFAVLFKRKQKRY